MSLLITIFGGMLLTVLLYVLGRKLILSNYWSSVLAAAVPSVAYMVYAVYEWPGLDVVTMHVVSYPTVAVMLYLLYGEKAGANGGGVHWVPKIIIGFFVAITVLYGGFVYVAKQGIPPAFSAWLLPNAAGKNVHTGFAGVVAHGDDAAKSIAHHRNMEEKLARLGWRVMVEGLDSLKMGQEGVVTVSLKNARGDFVNDVRVMLVLERPGQESGQRVVFAVDPSAARYHGVASLPGQGVWLAVLSLEKGGEMVTLERVVGGE